MTKAWSLCRKKSQITTEMLNENILSAITLEREKKRNHSSLINSIFEILTRHMHRSAFQAFHGTLLTIILAPKL